MGELVGLPRGTRSNQIRLGQRVFAVVTAGTDELDAWPEQEVIEGTVTGWVPAPFLLYELDHGVWFVQWRRVYLSRAAAQIVAAALAREARRLYNS